MEMLTNPQTAGDEGKEGKQRQECPHLRRAKVTSWYPIEGYCSAQPEGVLRVVTIAEFHELCTTAEHIRCKLYRKQRKLTNTTGELKQGGA